jgi:hypothetical protein
MTSSQRSSVVVAHPFCNSNSLLEVIPKDAIDVEEESRLYDELCEVRKISSHTPPLSPSQPFFSKPSPLVIIKEDDGDNYNGASDPRHTRALSAAVPPRSPTLAPSVFSHDIWLGDNSGESSAFARQVEVRGWTNVGDKLGGAYVGKSCIFLLNICHTYAND